MTERNDKSYVVTGSEDGVVAVANSGKKAMEMAVMYCVGVEQEVSVAEHLKRLRSEGHATVTTTGLRGLDACSDGVAATIEAFHINEFNGRKF